MLPDPPWSATHGLVLADSVMAPAVTDWLEALTSVGLQLWAARGWVLIGAGLVLLLAAGLALWDRRGAAS